MKDVMNYLKAASSNASYPLYAQYVHSDGERLYTCNGKNFSCANKALPFKGDVNIFVLEDILKNVDYDYTMETAKNTLFIQREKYKTNLIIDQIEFPIITVPELPTIEITEELLTDLKTAVKYTSSGIGQYVYMNSEFMCAYATEYAFYKAHTIDLVEPIGLTKEIISMLEVGNKIGVLAENVVVFFDSGFVMFTGHVMDDYPVVSLKNFIDNSLSGNLEYLMSMKVFSQISSALKPIFYNEDSKKQFINIENENNNLIATAKSVTNGISTYEIETSLEEKFRLWINLVLFSSVNINYDVFVNLQDSEVLSELILSDGSAYLIIKGGV